MATWTNFTTELDPDKPVRSTNHKAILANITALAEGAPGAPEIDGTQGAVVRTGGIFNSAVTAAKLASTERMTNENVRLAYSSTTTAQIGAVCFMKRVSSTATAPGDTVNGSDLLFSNAAGADDGSGALGAWRCMGEIASSDLSPAGRTTLFLRIA